MQIGGGITIGGGVQLKYSIPDTADNSLILHLDASETTSYPGTGTDWFDLSGRNNHFTLQGSTPWTDNAHRSYFTLSSGIAQGGYILPNTEYTKVGIFKVPGNFGNLISGDGHAFWGQFTDHLYSGHNGEWQTVGSTDAVPTNEWVFGAVSFSSTTGWRLYLNDANAVTNPSTDTFAANPALLEIGGFDGNGNNLNGDVAQIKIYNRVLSDAEITALYNEYYTRYKEIKFTLRSTDFTYGYNYAEINNHKYPAPIGADGNEGFIVDLTYVSTDNTNLDKVGYTPYVAYDFTNSDGTLYNYIKEKELDPEAGVNTHQGALYSVQWGPGSTNSSGYAVVAAYPGSNKNNMYFFIAPVDTTISGWSTSELDILNTTVLAGTYKFPATFTLVQPPVLKGNSWC